MFFRPNPHKYIPARPRRRGRRTRKKYKIKIQWRAVSRIRMVPVRKKVVINGTLKTVPGFIRKKMNVLRPFRVRVPNTFEDENLPNDTHMVPSSLSKERTIPPKIEHVPEDPIQKPHDLYMAGPVGKESVPPSINPYSPQQISQLKKEIEDMRNTVQKGIGDVKTRLQSQENIGQTLNKLDNDVKWLKNNSGTQTKSADRLAHQITCDTQHKMDQVLNGLKNMTKGLNRLEGLSSSVQQSLRTTTRHKKEPNLSEDIKNMMNRVLDEVQEVRRLNVPSSVWDVDVWRARPAK